MGGKGSVLSVEEHGDVRDWTVTAPDGTKKTIRINTKESNKY
jgi:adenylylsulfate reductase subunit B